MARMVMLPPRCSLCHSLLVKVGERLECEACRIRRFLSA